MKVNRFLRLISLVILLVLVASSKEKKKNICKSKFYQNRTLKLLHEQVIANSFVDHSQYGEKTTIPKRFEGSDVVLRSDGLVMYVVFDNTFQIAAFCTPLAAHSTNCTDQLLAWPDQSVDGLKSEFEGIAYNPLNDTYFVVQETLPSLVNEGKFQPNIFEIRIDTTIEKSVHIIESCWVEWEFDSDSKGFEGVEFVVHQSTGKNYLLGLCEANKCASSVSLKRKANNLGNGRLIVLEKQAATTNNNPCRWKPLGTINLPSSIQFLDYTAVSIYRRSSPTFPTYIAVTSQENSQVWIGLIDEIEQSPYFRVSELQQQNNVYDLPRATEDVNECQIKYCNIEGVAWRGKTQLILISDKTKRDQGAECIDKDQSVHYFVLPRYLND